MKNLKLNINFFVTSLLSLTLLSIFTSCNKESQLKSPDGKIAVICSLNENKEAVYSITRANEAVILPSKLGIIMSDTDFSKDLKINSISKIKRVSYTYEMVQGKRKECQYEGNE
jgi:hypothetical protein